MTAQDTTGRVNQKRRTRAAILHAAAALTATGAVVTMPEIAKAALVSEATAYRYFPDLAGLVAEAMADRWPTPERALAAVADSPDPVVRVAAVTEHLLRHVLTYAGAIRTVIAATITRPEAAGARPGLRFRLIDHALAPVADSLGAARLAQLRNDLTVVISAEALFSLTDLGGLDPEAAVASIVRTACTLTRSAVAGD